MAVEGEGEGEVEVEEGEETVPLGEEKRGNMFTTSILHAPNCDSMIHIQMESGTEYES